MAWALPGIAGAQQRPPMLNPVERMAPPQVPQLSPAITTPAPVAASGPNAGAQVRVSKVMLRGNTALSAEDLEPALAGLAGQQVSLARIEEARLSVLRAYRRADYPFAAVNAGLTPSPAGVELTFAITEGFVAEVKLEGNIGPAGTQVLRFLNTVVGDRPVTGRAIERALLLASDIPGVTVRGTLRPLSTEPGALQLVAEVSHTLVSGYANIDNRGYRYVGPWQGLLVSGVNSLSQFGERSEVSLFGTPQGAQWFVQGAEDVLLGGGSGLKVRLYAGTGVTRPFGKIGESGYLAEAQLGGIVATYPIIRSRPFNLYAMTQLDIFDSSVYTGFGTARTRASVDHVRTWRNGADISWLDSTLPFLPGATVVGNLRVHQGLHAMGATPSLSPTAARAGSNFGFTKVTAEVQRTQPLFSPFENSMVNLQATIGGQYSRDVLPTAEKYYLGGNRLLRGFYNGQVSGDSAWAFALELQLDTAFEVPSQTIPGNGRYTAQWYVFKDQGRTYQMLPTDPNRRLSSLGGGVRVVASETVQLDAEVAHRVTRNPDGNAAEPLNEVVGIFRMRVRY